MGDSGNRSWRDTNYEQYQNTLQITFAPNIPVPTPPSAAADCPNGNWTVVLTSLTYTNVVLHIQQPPGTDVLTSDFGTIDP
jgi:hypothetical protein